MLSGLTANTSTLTSTLDSTLTVLASRAKGDTSDFSLLNDLAVTSSGEVYFTETSRRFERRRIFWAGLDGRPSGRLLRWDRKHQQAIVEMEHLFMPNGVTPMHDGRRLLIGLNLVQAHFSHMSHPPFPHISQFNSFLLARGAATPL